MESVGLPGGCQAGIWIYEFGFRIIRLSDSNPESTWKSV